MDHFPFNEALFWRSNRSAFPRSMAVFPSVDSTNAYLLEQGGRLPRPALCLADLQTAGRGTWGRSWAAEGGTGLTFSVALSPQAGLDARRLTLLAMAAWRQVLQAECPEPVLLKWPNDLIAAGKKIGGVLTETARRNGIDFIVVGMGININQLQFPAEIADTATSLRLIAPAVYEREVLLATWCGVFDTMLNQGALSALAPAFLSPLFVHTGKTVRWSGGQGVFEGLSGEAFPRIRLENGNVLEITDPSVRFVHAP